MKAIAGTTALSALTIGTRKSFAETAKLTTQSLLPVEGLAVGDVHDFAYPANNAAFLIRLPRPALGGVGPQEDIVAFHRACPHMGCQIQTLQIENAILGPCGCHRSRFDLTKGGLQIIGRASQNLVQVTLAVEQGMVVATGIIGLPYGAAHCGDQ